MTTKRSKFKMEAHGDINTILALDFAYAKKTYVVRLDVETAKYKLYELPPYSKDHLEFLSALRAIIHENRDNKTLFICEYPSYIINVETFRKLVSVYSAIDNLILEMRKSGLVIDFCAVPPSVWQSAAFGARKNRKMLKYLSKKRASVLTGYQVLNDDISDSINIAIFAFEQLKQTRIFVYRSAK